MKKETINLQKKEEYTYPCAGEFIPNITAYLHEDERQRPADGRAETGCVCKSVAFTGTGMAGKSFVRKIEECKITKFRTKLQSLKWFTRYNYGNKTEIL